MYKNWINGLLGLIILGIAFVELSATTLMWTLGITGAVIAINSFWNMIVDQDDTRSRSRKTESRV